MYFDLYGFYGRLRRLIRKIGWVPLTKKESIRGAYKANCEAYFASQRDVILSLYRPSLNVGDLSLHTVYIFVCNFGVVVQSGFNLLVTH